MIMIIVTIQFRCAYLVTKKKNVMLNYLRTSYMWQRRLLMSRHFFLKINKRNEKEEDLAMSFFVFFFYLLEDWEWGEEKENENYDHFFGRDQCSLIVGVWISNACSSCFNIDFDHIFVLFLVFDYFFFKWTFCFNLYLKFVMVDYNYVYIYSYMNKRVSKSSSLFF